MRYQTMEILFRIFLFFAIICQNKTESFYQTESATGEVKMEAKAKMRDACSDYMKNALGDEKSAELKALKESGASFAELAAKVDALIATLDYPERTKVQAVANSCKIMFGSARKRRGEQAYHNAWKGHLSWLTQEQRNELIELKEGGADFNTLKNVVWEYYEAATGEVKVEATAQLRKACRNFIAKAVGDENAAELKFLKESGATDDEIDAKADEFIAAMPYSEKKVKAEAVANSCKIVFGGHSRRIRGNFDHLKENIDWLTREQKAELIELKDSGATKDQLKSKVMMFFGELPADKQEELKTKWKGKCISWVKDVASQEERDELKQLYEEKKWVDLKANIEVYIERLDADKKQKVLAARETCEKLFQVDNRL